MRTKRFYLALKPRVRKKYQLCKGRYLSPKEVKEWFRWYENHEKYMR